MRRSPIGASQAAIDDVDDVLPLRRLSISAPGALRKKTLGEIDLKDHVEFSERMFFDGWLVRLLH
jgi:hypothetical protein